MPTENHSSELTIAIIGGGASGTLVASQLLRQASVPLRILLFERMSETGQGVAYGTEFPSHLLNVPAGRMGAFPEEPDHFLKWVAPRVGRPGFPTRVAAGDFLPRSLYGPYLRDVLAEATNRAAPGVSLEIIKGEVIDIDVEGAGARLRCGGGQYFNADQVVLAIGNLPGEHPIRRALPVYRSQLYVHVPWRPGALAGIPPDEDVLLVGAGLTAIDLILKLATDGHRGVIHALSRRGLHPQAHQPVEPWRDFLGGNPLPATVRTLTRRIRVEIKTAAAAGHDWRAVIDAIRPHSQAIWQGLSWEERGRFMRHVRPFWEVHRHRVAPPIAARIAELQAAGRLRFYAGRLDELRERGSVVDAKFRSRGTHRWHSLQVARVINCTGPRTDYSKYQHPLLITLLANGLIDHDPLALGVNALPDGRVLRYRGGPVGWLYTLGAPLKGVLWECTALPEIRAHAAALATRLLTAREQPPVPPVAQPAVVESPFLSSGL